MGPKALSYSDTSLRSVAIYSVTTNTQGALAPVVLVVQLQIAERYDMYDMTIIKEKNKRPGSDREVSVR